MDDININFHVYCTRPGWAISNPNPKYTDVRYRIYVDDDLITERTWVWGNDIYLHENFYVRFDTAVNHRLRLEPVVYNENQASFEVRNTHSDGRGFAVIERYSMTDLLFKIN